ncbi:MAG: tRNA uridine-5-carboxymethylaminomethyl(34) synthesis GTPase MnmE [Alphaproteobacteria bacterium]
MAFLADTIFALASAPGRAGVAVMRISGPLAGEALRQLTGRDLPEPRRAALREFHHPGGALLDRGLALWFPAPHSFTGEDVAELHLHGGRAIVSGMAAALASMPGLRLAEPGEFTRRGFENGKFDLTEAEAVIDLINAETEAQLRQALRQADGALSRLYEDWRARLLRALAHIEADIDFADEDLPPGLAAARVLELSGLRAELAAHLADNRRGERLRDGYHIAILGPPNAGKSSLLNALARRDAAIVSAVAGTTRDVIELQLDLGGYPVIVADTAGLRESEDAIESEGIRRAAARAGLADLKLLVFDGASLPDLDPMTLALLDDRAMMVVNKQDLIFMENAKEASFPTPHRGERESRLISFDEKVNGMPAFAGMTTPFIISLKTNFGIEALIEALTARVAAELADTGQPALTRLRHRTALEECAAHLDRALAGLQEKRETALTAEDVRLAMRALGRITGSVDTEDLLDVIFRDFCVGK